MNYRVDIHPYDGRFKYIAFLKWVPTGRSYTLFAQTKWGINREIKKQAKRCAWVDKQNSKYNA